MKDTWKPTAFDREHMARELLAQLEQEGGLWVAVRVQGTGWEIVRPQSQEAILAACATPPVQVEKLVEALERCAQIVDRNLYRQHEKIEDVPKIARQALATFRQSKDPA